jgi:hypothetical protein
MVQLSLAIYNFLLCPLALFLYTGVFAGLMRVKSGALDREDPMTTFELD